MDSLQPNTRPPQEKNQNSLKTLDIVNGGPVSPWPHFSSVFLTVRKSFKKSEQPLPPSSRAASLRELIELQQNQLLPLPLVQLDTICQNLPIWNWLNPRKIHRGILRFLKMVFAYLMWGGVLRGRVRIWNQAWFRPNIVSLYGVHTRSKFVCQIVKDRGRVSRGAVFAQENPLFHSVLDFLRVWSLIMAATGTNH